MATSGTRKQSTRQRRTQRDDVIEHLYADICRGWPRFQLEKKLENDSYELGTSGLARSTKQQYIKEAYDLIKDIHEEEKQRFRDLAYSRLTEIFNDCMINGDHQNAIAAQKEIDKLFIGYEPEKLDVKAEVANIVTIDFGFGRDDSEDEPEAD